MSCQLKILKENSLIAMETAEAFQQLVNLPGELISSDPISEMRRVKADGTAYFVKIYYQAGKHLRRFLGRSRARAEFENLNYFDACGIATPNIVAFGEFTQGVKRQACLITEEIPSVESLLDLKNNQDPKLEDPKWVRRIADLIAMYTSKLHAKGFIHIDLKWRNILVEKSTEKVYFIDCPQGHHPRINLERGKIKDLACLDKVAKYVLSHTQRLRFYMKYAEINKLSALHKQRIRKVLAFFEGRE